MHTPGVYLPKDIHFKLEDIPHHPEPLGVLVVNPAFFAIIDVKNPYMEGKEGHVNHQKVMEQWQALYDLYLKWVDEDELESLSELEGVTGCEDMVFCANQSLPWTKDGEKVVVLSNMRYPSRQKEVPAFEEFYTYLGYKIYKLNTTDLLEGNGDFIIHPGKNLFWAGYGHRTGLEGIKEAAGYIGATVIPLKLVSEYFYHLDTCFVPLSEDTVMLCEEAFDEESLSAIKKIFKNVISIDRTEAVNTFCLNATALRLKSGKKVAIIQRGSESTNKILGDNGYEVYEVETGEFMKSGGSVFCMKMMHF